MRILLIHWKPAEAAPRVAELTAGGYEVTLLAPNGFTALRGAEFARAVVIDLSRLPMQGRAVGIELRKRAATRRVPMVFAGGMAEKVAAIRELLPDAVYAEWGEMAAAVEHAVRNAPASPRVPGTMAGYSGTPLTRKLGIQRDTTVALLGAPAGFESKLELLPEGVKLTRTPRGAMRAILFIASLQELERGWNKTATALAPGATLWIAWPKKASGVLSDATEQEVRAYGLARGWVDYKICAIDETWSGLAFSLRKMPRTTGSEGPPKRRNPNLRE